MARYTSWSSMEFATNVEGQASKIHVDIRAYSLSDSVEKALVHGAGRAPLGTTDSVYMGGTGTLELYEEWARAFMKDITNNGEIPLSDVEMIMTVKHRLRGSQALRTDVIKFTITQADDDAAAATADPRVTVFNMLVESATRDGVSL